MESSSRKCLQQVCSALKFVLRYFKKLNTEIKLNHHPASVQISEHYFSPLRFTYI